MSAHVVVIATDLRRTTIKVSPGTYLSDVLHQACTKLNLNPDGYLIRHKQRQVDLSVPFRTAGLIPGAKLELVQKSKTPSAVQVALQVPLPEGKEIPGGRLIHRFPSDLSLWKVLRQFESGVASNGKNVNITARGVARPASGAGGSGAGQLYYETPALNIMGRELASFEQLQKTLSQLGYNSGSVLIRLSFKLTERTLFDAMEKIGQFFHDADEEAAEPGAAPTASQNNQLDTSLQTPAQQASAAVLPDAAAAPSESQPDPAPSDSVTAGNDPSTADAAMPDVAPPSQDPYQPVNVFLAPSDSVPAAARLTPADETDFTPTAAHAQLHQARLLENSRNKRLPSDRELADKAAAEKARLAAIRSVRVKVRFPDNTSSEWDVGPAETGAFLHEAVRHVMAAPAQPFRLYVPGAGKTAIKDDASPKHNLVRAYKMSGRVLVNLTWDDAVPADVRKQPFLKSAVAQHGQAVKVPEVPQAKDEGPASAAAAGPAQPERPRDDDGGAKKKIPKWLKLGKK